MGFVIKNIGGALSGGLKAAASSFKAKDEGAAEAVEETARRREQRRRAVGAAALQVHLGSRRLTLGALLTMFVGILASIPMTCRILFPRWTARLRRRRRPGGRFR